jgi:hypothetical protein
MQRLRMAERLQHRHASRKHVGQLHIGRDDISPLQHKLHELGGCAGLARPAFARQHHRRVAA